MKDINKLVDRYMKELQPYNVPKEMLYEFIGRMENVETDADYLELIGEYVQSVGEGDIELDIIINFANDYNALVRSDKPYVRLELEEEDDVGDEDPYIEEVPGSVGSLLNNAFKPLGSSKRSEAEIRSDFRESLRAIEDAFEEIISYIDLP